MVKRILILDDDHSNAEVLSMIMEQGGFEAAHIQSSRKLLPLIKDFKPHVLFLDIQLGQSDGRLICNELKANKATQNLPIVLISALLPTQIEKIPSKEDGIINKPFDMDEVIGMVKRLI
ncbi:response regulator [Pedobacter chinensis]|uniref:Response regulator n=2 Tax=Pedobacter chinensis TaxID=2282421 RepID=A0A369Q4T7_9SPHI|nr:response regulator [Pedobacter chinensis]